MALKFNGVTYYKLSERLYGEDKVKNCSLTASEIDWNFNFLRGNDIKDGYFDGDDATIYLVRENDDIVAIPGLKEYLDREYAKLEADIDLDNTEYDPEYGVLTIVVNGVEKQLSGFTIPSDITIKTEYGLQGNGTDKSPLRLDLFTKTGYYAPVESLIDLTAGEKLPTDEETLSACKKYLTKEYVPVEGLEYTYSAVRKIAELLEQEGKGWRIANLDDWNNMLEAVEDDCDEDVDYTPHATSVEGSENGYLAGNRLKVERDGWSGGFCDGYGLSIRPTGHGANGKEETTFWTTTKHGDGGIHAKKFHANAGTVQHRIENTDANNLHSIRLVNDNVNLVCTQVICGVPYECVKMKSVGGVDKVWTTANAYFSEFLATGEARVPEIASEAPARYFLNEWNPYEGVWVKHEVEDSYLVDIKNYEGEEDVEVMVKNGELVKRNDVVYNQIVKPVYDELSAGISEVSDTLREHVEFTNDTLSAMTLALETLSGNTEAKFEAVSSNLESVNEGLSELREDVDENAQAIQNTNNELNAKIDGVSDEVNTRIDDLANGMSDMHTELSDSISGAVTAINNRIDQNNENFGNELQAEREERENADNGLRDDINNLRDDLRGEMDVRITGLGNQIGNLNDSIGDLADTVSELNTATSAIRMAVEGNDGLAERVAGVETHNADLDRAINEYAVRMNENEASDRELKNRVTALETRIVIDESQIQDRATVGQLGDVETELNNRITQEILDLKANEICDLQNQISALSATTEAQGSDIQDLKDKDVYLQQEINRVDEEKVDKIPGKGLSTNDFTDSDLEKLNSVESGAQVNVLEAVKVNGAPLPIVDKAVDITIPTDLVHEGEYEEFVNGTNQRLSDLEGRATDLEQGVHEMDDRYSGITHSLSDRIESGLDELNDTYTAITHDLSDRIATIEELLGNEGAQTLSGKTVTVHIEEIKDELAEVNDRLSAIKGVLEPVKASPTVSATSNMEKSYLNGTAISPIYYITLTPHTLKYVNGYEIPVETVVHYTLWNGDTVVKQDTETISSRSTVTVNAGNFNIDANNPIEPKVTITYDLATAVDPVSGNEVTMPAGDAEFLMDPVVGYYPIYYKSMVTSSDDYDAILAGGDIPNLVTDGSEMRPKKVPIDTGTNTVFILFPQASLEGPIKKIVDDESGFDLLDDFDRKSRSFGTVPYYLYAFRTENVYNDRDIKFYRIIY